MDWWHYFVLIGLFGAVFRLWQMRRMLRLLVTDERAWEVMSKETAVATGIPRAKSRWADVRMILLSALVQFVKYGLFWGTAAWGLSWVFTWVFF